MPIITIKLFVAAPQDFGPAFDLQAVADQLGTLFGSGPGQTWVRLECQPRTHYAENGIVPEATSFPTFVEILKARLPAPEVLAVEADQIATIVSRVVGCPKENTHVLYLPEAVGRIAFNGRLLT